MFPACPIYMYSDIVMYKIDLGGGTAVKFEVL